MNKKMIRILTVAAATLALSLPVIAQPALQQIQAFLNPTLTYTLDGQEIMDGVDAITYNDTTYISVRELVDALGKEIALENGVISITTPEAVPATPLQPAVGLEATLKLTDDAATDAELGLHVIESATIVEVNTEESFIIILPTGQEDTPMNHIHLNIAKDSEGVEDTMIRHKMNRMAYQIEALEEGMLISAKTQPMMTMSIPAQTTAVEIVVLAEEAPVTPEFNMMEDAKILEVNTEGNFIVVLPAGQEDQPINHIRLNIAKDSEGVEDTIIRHEMNRMAYQIEALEEGMLISAKTQPMMTMSIPAQTAAIEIIVQAQ